VFAAGDLRLPRHGSFALPSPQHHTLELSAVEQQRGPGGDGQIPPVLSPPGWYFDPANRARLRWWDGYRWTSAVAPGPHAYPYPYPRGYPQQALKPARRLYQRSWFWIVISLVLVLGGCAGFAALVVHHVINDQHVATYQVTGDGRTATIIYTGFDDGASSGDSTANSATLPWTLTVRSKGDLVSYSVDAFEATGHTISCTITVDGVVKSSQTGTGPFATAICTASPE
jgi:hypothetical protein